MPRKTKEPDNKKESLKDILFPKKTKKSEKKETLSNDKNIKKESKPKTSTQKSSSSKTNSSAKKKTTPKKTTSSKPKKVKQYSPEYYDLPYKYDKTVVKILAQTPNNLFVYWEISNEDRENLKNQYGQYFFEITKPVLIIHNDTMDYSFEIDVNDFANSWYIHVNDSNCEYRIELGRRPIPINYNYMPQYDIKKDGPINPVQNNYIYISSSNRLESPNDHILFNVPNKIYFRNIKTNQVTSKDIKDYPFIINNNEFINIYELYKDLFKDEMANNKFDLRNPSSGGNPSSRKFFFLE